MSSLNTLKGRTLFISGATRGIGLAIAIRAAKDGANVAFVGKTKSPHPKLPGTLQTAAEEIEAAGGKALGLQCDIREEEQVEEAVEKTVEKFGGIDILVNNASAIFLASTVDTPMKRFDLMHQVNARGSFLCAQKCLPYLAQGTQPHILTLSPPLSMKPDYFAPHLAYSMAKFGMSLCTLAWASELRAKGIAANSLWPRTVIDTSAVRNLLGGEEVARKGRSPEFVAEAAHHILTRPSSYSGNFLIDDEVMREAGVQDFSPYSSCPENELLPDFFLPEP